MYYSVCEDAARQVIAAISGGAPAVSGPTAARNLARRALGRAPLSETRDGGSDIFFP